MGVCSAQMRRAKATHAPAGNRTERGIQAVTIRYWGESVAQTLQVEILNHTVRLASPASTRLADFGAGAGVARDRCEFREGSRRIHAISSLATPAAQTFLLPFVVTGRSQITMLAQ